eukprot:745525-Pyramimonas_sp.AAC.1
MVIPAMAIIIQVDGPAGRNSFWIRDDCAPATQWTGDRLLLGCCCGPESSIGNPKNFDDNSCKVIRYTEKEDMRTDKGRILVLNDKKKFNGTHIALWGSMPCTGGSPWQYANETHYFRTGNHRAMRRLRGIRADFIYLFWNSREIARAARKAGGAVCLEWLTQRNYWRDPR